MYKRILVPADGSENVEMAVEYAISLNLNGADVIFLK